MSTYGFITSGFRGSVVDALAAIESYCDATGDHVLSWQVIQGAQPDWANCIARVHINPLFADILRPKFREDFGIVVKEV